jgi:hypothetical protein
MSAHVSIDDLALAAEWLDCYEPAGADDNSADRAGRVAKWLRSEIERREQAAADRREILQRQRS